MLERLTRFVTAVGLTLLIGVLPAWPQAALLPNAKQTFVDQNGKPLSNGKVYMYVPNTTNLKTTWSDAGETIPNTNPVALDAAGRAVIFGQGTYQQRVDTSGGLTQWSAPTTAYNASPVSGATGTDTAPVGSVMSFTGFTLPTNWAYANGQALNRSTYSELMTAITITNTTVSCTSGSATLAGWTDTSNMRVGAPVEATCVPVGTTITAIVSGSTITVNNNATATGTVTATVFPWGNGDGVNSFNIIDMRGRVPSGPDALGGTGNASRLLTTTTINTTSGSPIIVLTSAVNINAGMSVVSTNVPAGTTVSSVVGTAAVTPTVTTVSGSPTVTVSSATGIVVGMSITSTNIPANTTVTTIQGTTLTVSANATGSAGGTASTFNITGTLSANATGTASGTSATFYAFASANASGASGGNLNQLLTSAQIPNAALSVTPFTPSVTGGPVFAPSAGSAQSGVNGGAAFNVFPTSVYTNATQINPVGFVAGGNGAFSSLQPTITTWYIVKIKSNTTGAGGVVSLGGMFGDIACDATFLCAPVGSSPAVNYVGLAKEANQTFLANISGITAQPTPTTWTAWLDNVCGSTRGMIAYRGAGSWTCLAPGSANFGLTLSASLDPQWTTLPGTGTVTSVGLSAPGGIFGVTGSPVTISGTLGLTVTGTSGAIPYFSSGSVLTSSAVLGANQVVLGGGAGVAPSTNIAFSFSSNALNLGTPGSILGKFILAGSSSGTLTVQASAAASGTLTYPSATDTLMGKQTTDTMLNKTFDTAGAGNSFSINGVAMTANTGTGAVARATNPVFVGPTLGAATATTINGNTLTPGTWILSGASGKTLTFNNALTLAGTDGTTMTFPSVSATIPRVVASGAKALATGAIASATCTSAQTDTATGTLTTDTISGNFNADPTAVTGYVPLTSGMLTIMVWPTADLVNFKVCNNTNASITPGAVTINWRVVR